ncbi:hypothetical protein Mgra_00009685, partial [Meloidogyne graminicola]
TIYIYKIIYLLFVHSKWTYTKIGTIQRRLAWPLRKDDTQIREAFQIFFKIFKFNLIIFINVKNNFKNIKDYKEYFLIFYLFFL